VLKVKENIRNKLVIIQTRNDIIKDNMDSNQEYLETNSKYI